MTATWLVMPVALALVLAQAYGYHYVGCYRDGGNRDLPVRVERGSMSPDRCNQLCTSRHFKFFGLQNGDECWCGNSYGKYGARTNDCKKRCRGHDTQICGNGWRNSIYTTDFTSGLSYIGCFIDSAQRDLGSYVQSGGMSVNRCYQICLSRGFAYFGVQYADYCFCGNSFGRYGARPDNECNMHCNGDRSSMCGGGWRNNVYTTGNAVPRPTVSHSGMRIRDSMAAKLSSMYSPIPSGVYCASCLITGFGRHPIVHRSDNFPVSELNSRLSSFPEKARSKLQALQFGANAKTTFEDSHIRINGNAATRSTYFGMAERVGGRVLIGMVSADLSAGLVTKYNTYTKRVCKRIIFWNKCHDQTYDVARGYRGDEIRLIDAAMQSETMAMFTENMRAINV